MLRQRLTFGTLMLAAFVGLFWLDARLESRLHGAAVTLLAALICGAAARELARLLHGAGHVPAGGWAILCSAALPCVPWLHRQFSDGGPADSAWMLGALVAAGFGAFAAVMMRRRVEGAAASISATLLIIFYIGLCGSFVPRIRIEAATPWLIIYVILVIKCCDIGAYFTGLAIGRTRLIPWLSPKKSVEGLAGGMLASMLVAAGLAGWFSSLDPQTAAAWAAWGVDVGGGAGHSSPWPAGVRAWVFGGAMALLGQFGDLCESLLKRDAGAKDSAAVVPAFGGLLDILDSILICAPAAYWMLVT